VVITPAVDQGANLASTWLARPRVGGRRGDTFLPTCEFAADIPPGTELTRSELTPTLKIRRATITARYTGVITSLFEG
jgi:hypothetical protein